MNVWITTLLVAASAVVLIVLFALPAVDVFPARVARVNCSVAEFSPDITPKFKQLCREARSKK